MFMVKSYYGKIKYYFHDFLKFGMNMVKPSSGPNISLAKFVTILLSKPKAL